MRLSRWLCVALALSGAAGVAYAGDGPAVVPVAPMVDAPPGVGAGARISWARAAAARGGVEVDLALAVLLALADDPAFGAEAADGLIAVLGAAPPRGAWSDVYAVAIGRARGDTQLELRLRRVEGWLELPDGATWAEGELAAMSAEPLPDAVRERAVALRARASGVGGDVAVGTDAEALEARARLLDAEGQRVAAAELWVAAVRAAPDGAGAAARRREATRRLLAIGDDKRAAAWVGEWPELEVELRAVGLAWLASADAVEELKVAADLAPHNPFIARRYGEALRDGGWNADALPWLALAARADGLSRAALGVFVGAAWEAGQPERVVEPLLAGLGAARLPWDWDALRRELAGALLGAAANESAAGAAERATAHTRLALALEPNASGALALAAGQAWGRGATAEAAELYAAAAAVAPDDAGVRDARVRLLGQLGQWDEAHAALDAGGAAGADAQMRLSMLEALAEARQRQVCPSPGVSAEVAGRADDAEVASAYADTLLACDSPAAVEAYEHAAVLDPASPWPTLGLANALMLRAGPGDAARVAALLPALEAASDPKVARWGAELRLRLARADAEAAREAGPDRAAFAAYVALLRDDEGSSVRARLGELYLDHWQYDEAERCFESAVRRIPVDDTAWMGLARTAMARGDFAAAHTLMDEHGLAELRGADGLPFRVELGAREATVAVIAELAAGHPDAARLRVAELLAAAPNAVEPLVLDGDRLLAEGDADAAFARAERAVQLRPDDEAALGLALASAWQADRLAEVLPLLERGAELRGARRDPDWVAVEAAFVRLSVAVEAAVAPARAGHWVRARRALAGVTGPDTPRVYNRLGGAWLTLGRPTRAKRSFERALTLDPGSVEAARGLAGSYAALGWPSRAARVLEAAARRHADPRLVVDAAGLRVDLGRYHAAGRLLETLDGAAPVATARRVAAPEPLPALPRGALEPSERRDDGPVGAGTSAAIPVGPDVPSAPPAGTRLAWAGAGPAVAPDTGASVRVRLDAARVPTDHAEVITTGRAGTSGGEQILVALVALGRDAPAFDGARWNVEAAPAWVSDGAIQAFGVGAALGLSALPGARFGWELSAGASYPGLGGPIAPTGHVELAWRPGSLDLGLSATRAPATQTRFAWAGAPLADGGWQGRVLDDQAQARVAGHVGSFGVGVLGRVGILEGPSLVPVGWRQVVGWLGTTAPLGPLRLDVGADGQVQGHDRAAERQVADEAGAYTPIFSALARGRIAASWSPTPPLDLCAAAAAGAQWTRSQEWFLAPELAPAWTVGGSARWAFAGAWRLGLAGVYDKPGRGWDAGAVLLGLWHGPRGDGTTGPTISSAVHGMPFRDLGTCAGGLG